MSFSWDGVDVYISNITLTNNRTVGLIQVRPSNNTSSWSLPSDSRAYKKMYIYSGDNHDPNNSADAFGFSAIYKNDLNIQTSHDTNTNILTFI